MLNAVHEGVAMEAGTCLASLVTKCVDTNMVREGIKAMAAARAAGKSGTRATTPGYRSSVRVEGFARLQVPRGVARVAPRRRSGVRAPRCRGGCDPRRLPRGVG